MTSALAEKLPTGAELAGITDPRARLQAAAETARKATEMAEPHRERRNAAALQLFRAGQVSAVVVWRDIMGISRALWTRLLEKADKGLLSPGEFADPRAVAVEESRLADEFDAIAKAAQKVRNTTARGLMNGEFGKPVSNAEVAKLAGLTTARMAQLRGSY